MNNNPDNINFPADNVEGKNDLLRYLNDELDSGHDFDRDATDGLQELPNGDIPAIIQKLNTELNRTLTKKKKRRHLPDQSAIYITIIIILLLITVAYVVLRKSIH